MQFHSCGVPEISGIYEEKRAFIGTISELLSDVYPELNVSLWPYSLSSLFVSFRSSRVLSFSSLGTRDCRPDWIFHSSRWRCRIISSVSTSSGRGSAIKRIIGFWIPFTPSSATLRYAFSRCLSRYWLICLTDGTDGWNSQGSRVALIIFETTYTVCTW